MSFLTSFFSSLVHGTNPAASTVEKNQQQRQSPIVELYRYLRFWSPYYDIIDSNSGITFKVILNYDTGLIEYVGTICENDNFSKMNGQSILNKLSFSRQTSKIPMRYNSSTGRYEIVPHLGTVGMIVDHLMNNSKTPEDKLYLRAIKRMMKKGFVPYCGYYNEKKLKEDGFI